MNRRAFFQFTLAAGAAAGAGNMALTTFLEAQRRYDRAQTFVDAVRDTAAMPNARTIDRTNLGRFISNAYAAGDRLVFLGDTDHSDIARLGGAYHPFTLDAARKAGATDIFGELPMILQPAIERIGAGIGTAAQLREIMMAFEFNSHVSAEARAVQTYQLAAGIAYAETNGLKVHAADHRQGRVKTTMDRARAAIRSLVPDTSGNELKDDAPLADFISARLRDRAIAVYGAAHGQAAGDIRDMLAARGIRSAHIAMLPDFDTAIAYAASRKRDESPSGNFYIMSHDCVVSVPQSAGMRAVKSPARTYAAPRTAG